MDLDAFKRYLALGSAPSAAKDAMLDLSAAAASGRFRPPMKSLPKPRLPPGSLAEHDRRFHPGGYREGQGCRFREEMVKGDYTDQLVTEAERRYLAEVSGGKEPPPLVKTALSSGSLHPDSEFRLGEVFPADLSGQALQERIKAVVPEDLMSEELERVTLNFHDGEEKGDRVTPGERKYRQSPAGDIFSPEQIYGDIFFGLDDLDVDTVTTPRRLADRFIVTRAESDDRVAFAD